MRRKQIDKPLKQIDNLPFIATWNVEFDYFASGSTSIASQDRSGHERLMRRYLLKFGIRVSPGEDYEPIQIVS